MGRGTSRLRRADPLGRAAAAALALLGAAALLAAVRLGAAAGTGRADLLAELRARSAERIARERGQIRPVLEAASRGDGASALAAAETALARFGENSQLHLFLAGAYRERRRDAEALREYRRAVEISRDYADRRASCYLGDELGGWLRAVRPRLAVAGADPAALSALRDLGYLQRALAGGCS